MCRKTESQATFGPSSEIPFWLKQQLPPHNRPSSFPAPILANRRPWTTSSIFIFSRPAIRTPQLNFLELSYLPRSYEPRRATFVAGPTHIPLASLHLNCFALPSRSFTNSSLQLFSSSFPCQVNPAAGVSSNGAEIFHRRSFP